MAELRPLQRVAKYFYHTLPGRMISGVVAVATWLGALQLSPLFWYALPAIVFCVFVGSAFYAHDKVRHAFSQASVPNPGGGADAPRNRTAMPNEPSPRPGPRILLDRVRMLNVGTAFKNTGSIGSLSVKHSEFDVKTFLDNQGTIGTFEMEATKVLASGDSTPLEKRAVLVDFLRGIVAPSIADARNRRRIDARINVLAQTEPNTDAFRSSLQSVRARAPQWKPLVKAAPAMPHLIDSLTATRE